MATGCTAAALLATACNVLPPQVPAPGSPASPVALDCAHWRYGAADEPAAGVLPAEYDRDNYKRTSLRDTAPELFNSPQNLCGQKGAAVDLAWGVDKGRDDVLVAVLDSGIMWRRADRMADLATAAFVNLGEARPPCASATGDCDGNGVFDVADFGAIADRNGNDIADPEDLILDPTYSNGKDDDRNGYVDDISGWDFLYGDNDPLDTVEYGHGTGEAEDSNARENGTGDVGTCPRCRVLPVRVSDSFVAEGGRFAAGVLFALDSGADVVQEALGAVTNPPQAQAAIDAAYARGVVIVASMADEASKHPNLPASLERTMAVNSVTVKEDLLTGAETGYLALNGCTNFGGHTFVSIPSGACSSEATGQSAGMVGLLESTARDAGIATNPALPHRAGGGNNVLSANEAMQVVRATADDIDFATPNAVDPANNFGTSTGGLIDTVRYPTSPGWDATFGYGRINAYEIVKAVRDGRIPPEAEVSSPLWFDVLPTHGTVNVTGRVAAARASSYDYRVEWATGLQPPPNPAADTWHVVAQGTNLRQPRDGVLGSLDLAQVAAALPDGGTGAPVDPATGKPAEERFSVRLRVVVTAHGGAGDGLQGIGQKQVFVHDDPDLVSGFPRRVDGASSAQPVFANLDGKPGDELIVATDAGIVHAYDAGGKDIKGWPVRTPDAAWWPSNSKTARAEHIDEPGAAISTGAPVVADLDGDGKIEVVVSDTDGNVWAWNAQGAARPGFKPVKAAGRVQSGAHTDPAFSRDDTSTQDQFNRTKPGFASAPAAADLDGDGKLEVVGAALDRHVYAWHDDGTPVAGFPVLVVDPAKVGAIDPVSHKVTFIADSGVREGGELIATPTLVDLTGDERPEIVIGAQEEYQETPNIGDGASMLALLGGIGDFGNSRLYAISPDGHNATNPDRSPAHPDDQAYLPGWPAALGQLGLEVLPTIGDGITTQVAAGDVSPHPGIEIVAVTAAGPPYVLDATGHSVYGEVGGHALPAAWAGGLAGEGAARFGSRRNTQDIALSIPAFSGFALGRLDGDDRPELAAPTMGFTRLVDIQASDLQLPNDDEVSGWQGSTGDLLPGFPQVTSDMAFFVTPAIADLDGDGTNEVIAGNGLYLLGAHDQQGDRPAGWPKLTGGWLVGTPSLGDWDGDGHAELAVARRDGVVLLWHTAAATASLTEWTRGGGNNRNTGVYHG
jgi:hypothetical protein